MKLLVFIALVLAGWYLLRWLQAPTPARKPRDRGSEDSGAGHKAQPRATDLAACPRCGSWVPAEFPVSCGRRDCPYPGVG